MLQYISINTRLLHFVYKQQVSNQSHHSVSAISYEKNRTCSIMDNFCRTMKSCTTFNVTHAIKIVRYCRTTISYDFYRLSDISFTIMTMREHFSWYAFTINPQRTAYHCCIRRIIIFFIISLRNNKIG